jgi:GNAT superfamily N-acetyltransferase
MSLDRARAHALQVRGLHDWVAMLGASSEGARTFERDGVIGAVVPASPERSIANSVAYEDPAALASALDDLAAVYDEAGVAAWTVWVPEFDSDAVATLEGAGHKLDGLPTAMSLELDDLRPVEVGELDYEAGADPADLGPMNELAYGASAAGMALGLAAPPDFATIWAARREGVVACVMATIDHDDDLGVYFVATHPEHRGRGLATRLMTAALLDARERGLRTSSLQGSPMGRPIYERLGYSVDFTLHMYERRR